MNAIEALNRTLFLRINGGNDTPTWVVQVASGIADDLIVLIPLLLLGFWLRGDHARRSMALKASLVTLISLGAGQVISALWPHPRPFMIGLGHTWATHVADASFPSDHMTVFAGIGLTLLFDGAAGWGLATMLTGLCVAWARVFLGLHFPLDMAGAVAVAGAVYAIVSLIWRKVGTPCTNLAEKMYRTLLARPIAAGLLRR